MLIVDIRPDESNLFLRIHAIGRSKKNKILYKIIGTITLVIGTFKT